MQNHFAKGTDTDVKDHTYSFATASTLAILHSPPPPTLPSLQDDPNLHNIIPGGGFLWAS